MTMGEDWYIGITLEGKCYHRCITKVHHSTIMGDTTYQVSRCGLDSDVHNMWFPDKIWRRPCKRCFPDVDMSDL